MSYVLLALRVIHIFASIFWIGSALTVSFFVSPSVGATGAAGQAVMGYLMNARKLSRVIGLAALLTTLSGIALYWIDADGLTSAWVTSGAGLGFGIGGAAGILAYGFGSVYGQSITRLGQISAQIQGQPSAAQLAQLGALKTRMARIAPIHTAMQIIAVICMATARYWGLL